MKSAGVNGLVSDTQPSTVFALATPLQQQGVHLKATVLPTGGGGDLINSGPAAIQAAQGDDFLSDFEPPEMNTAATQKLQNALAKYAGVHTDPTFAEYMGYLSVLGLVQGLQGAGSNPTQSSTIKALSHITNYDAEGLWGGHQTVELESAAARTGRVLLDDQAVRIDVPSHFGVGPGVRNGDQGQARLEVGNGSPDGGVRRPVAGWGLMDNRSDPGTLGPVTVGATCRGDRGADQAASRSALPAGLDLAEVPADDLVGTDAQPGVAAVVFHPATGVLFGEETFGNLEFRDGVARPGTSPTGVA